MAKKLKEFGFRRSRGGRATYPWDKWLDGGIWELAIGEDFEVPVSSFRVSAFLAAARNGKKVRTQVDGNKITIQAYEPKSSGKKR